MAELFNTVLFNDASLKGYWRMENDWTDSSSDGYTLTPASSPTFTTGKYGLAGSFVRTSSQYASIASASSSNLEISGSQSFVCWVKITTLVSFVIPMARSKSDNTINHSLTIDGAGVVYFTLTGLTTNVQVNSGATVIDAGNWHHLAGVYNSVGTTLKIYIDGAEAGSVTASGSATNTTGDFAIGRNGANPTSFFDGQVDDVAVFNRVLTVAEILTLFQGAFLKTGKLWGA